jgi:hypothetical protein
MSSYRVAVSDLVAEIGRNAGSEARLAEQILTRRLDEEPLAAVLSATPYGSAETTTRLLRDIRDYRPNPCSSAGSLARFVRISMLAQIDVVWWGHIRNYLTDADLCDAPDLVDLDALESAGQLRFRYRHQASTLLERAARSAERRALPGRSPRTAGLSLARARPQAVAWLNLLAHEFAAIAPPGTPPLWVTSLARSITHQRHLKSLGYVALLPSAHCVGYAADIEMAWYRRFHAHRILRALLLDRQRADEVNIIDEGQAWHVCLHPKIAARIADVRQHVPTARTGT